MRFARLHRAVRTGVLGAALLALMIAGGCDGKPTAAAPPPAPVEVQADSTGHYCGMLLADHEGPKGQIHLASRKETVWFSSVRDTIAFTRLPDEPRDITAIYVNDMGRAKNWAQPEPGTWIDARQAWYVIDSDRRGGMGAPEAVPFSDQAAAEAFRGRYHGRVVRLADIPDAYVLGPVDLPGAAARPAASQPSQ
ncbi:MAG TPA: nitrous oxide reductase accessory protein NosL [Ideonella sp.]|nr:nitrous oxide reductase accessory protein NosL [Ideonella sp.]